MKIIQNNKILKKIYFLNRWKQIMLVIGLLFLVFLLIQLPFITSTLRFFVMMNKSPGWGLQTEPIDDLKEVARFLLTQPEQDRRKMLAAYRIYVATRTDAIYTFSKLHLLMLLLFDVPESYPREDIKYFGGWVIYPKRPKGENNANLLWPFGYQNGKLVLKASQMGYMGPPYDVLDEYDYFAARFPFRSVEDLE